MKKLFMILCLFVLAAFNLTACLKQIPSSTTELGPEHTANQEDKMQVKASHILVDTKEQALELKQKIDEGADFAELAKKYSKCPSGSNGGDLGYFGKGQMVPEFEKAAFETEVGKVSEPVQTQFGWHLIKVEDKG